MSITATLTESEVMSGLITKAKVLGAQAPRAIVVSRVQPINSLTRTVRIALVISLDNESVVDGLIRHCFDDDSGTRFVGSEANLQGEVEVDYLFFEAKIMAKK